MCASAAGRSKGWGIVEFETPEEALTAINTLNGVELGGRTILVREDREDRDVKQVGGAAAARWWPAARWWRTCLPLARRWHRIALCRCVPGKLRRRQRQ